MKISPYRVGIRTCSDYSPFGVELDGRTVSGGYRYGYQGSEKDNETKGNGNSYTTEFRQYDPRLGRWLSIDPVTKEHRSQYDGFNNNPIIYVDPRGDDDYYNANGTYNKYMSEKHNTDGHNIYVLSPNGKSKTLLSDMPIKTDNDRKVVERVLSGYAKKAGVSGAVTLKYSKSEGEGHVLAFTNDKKVFVNKAGGISDLLSNYHNFESVMFHEKQHQDDQKAGKDLSDKTFEGLLNHAKIYYKQFNDKSFERTSKDFKNGQFGSLEDYLYYALNKTLGEFEPDVESKKVTDLIDNLNKTAGKKYGRYFSYQKISIGGELKWIVSETKTKK